MFSTLENLNFGETLTLQTPTSENLIPQIVTLPFIVTTGRWSGRAARLRRPHRHQRDHDQSLRNAQASASSLPVSAEEVRQ